MASISVTFFIIIIYSELFLNVGCLFFSVSHAALIILCSGLLVGLPMTDGVPLCVFISSYAFIALAVCLGYLDLKGLCIVGKWKSLPIRSFPGGFSWSSKL